MNNKNQQADKFDAIFLSIAYHQPQGTLQLLDSFAGFLSRKTDFFIGTNKGDWENLVLETFRKYEKISLDAENAKQREEAARKAVAPQTKLNVANTTAQSAKITELTEEEAEKLQQEIDTKKNNTKIVPITENCVEEPAQRNAVEIYKPKVDKTAKHEIEKPTLIDTCNHKTNDYDNLEEGKLMPNKGNGYDFEKYSWTQSLSEIEVTVPLKSKVRQNDVVIKFSKKHLTVGLKNQTPIIDDKLQHDIKLEGSTWILQDGKAISLSLEKVKENWWSKIVVSDPEISIRNIIPEQTNVSDLDEDMRGTVEKMMFEQKQEAMGLPLNEDHKKEETFKEFMQKYPGMDFSKYI